MVATEVKRQLITAGEPDEEAFVPPADAFVSEYLHDSHLANVGAALIRRRFPHLERNRRPGYEMRCKIDYLWREKGGTSAGNLVLGKCVKVSGLARYFSGGSDYVVWLAADHARALRLNKWQLEALLYHELSHIDLDDDDETGEPTAVRTRGHDAEIFYDELAYYGVWRRSLEPLVSSMQVALPFLFTVGDEPAAEEPGPVMQDGDAEPKRLVPHAYRASDLRPGCMFCQQPSDAEVHQERV